LLQMKLWRGEVGPKGKQRLDGRRFVIHIRGKPPPLKTVNWKRSMRFELKTLQLCRFLAGPTACGKTEVGLRLARRLNAEIVALDSMSLYRGMDVGTAKPDMEARRAIRHHLIDILDPHQAFSLADYVAAAETCCRQILDRGRVPLFVGGTGLYLRGVLRGVFEGPQADWEFRRQLESEAGRSGPEALQQRLQDVDPASAEKLHPQDTRRIIRALEVHHLTGRPLSEQQEESPLPVSDRPQHVYWLNPSREWLHERINRRVEEMIARGLIDEVQTLLALQPPLGRTARQALGYKEVIDMLNTGGSIDEAIELIQTRTRQFAKRQYTWFRNLEECRPIDMTGDESIDELVEKMANGDTPSGVSR